MTGERDVGLQFAVVKPVLDPITQRREVEEKISAVEEWNNLLVENAAQMDMGSSMRPKRQTVFKEMPDSGWQLSFWFENGRVSEPLNYPDRSEFSLTSKRSAR